MAPLKLGIFGDAGNSITNGTPFYYTPGNYKRYDLGSSGPLQSAVAAMMRSWGVSELIQLGDASYNVNSSTLLDYNIGQYYNDFMRPYGNQPGSFAFANPASIYNDGSKGGVAAVAGGKQWPYNYYNFPNGFPNPVTKGVGGSSDGLNHYWLTPGNHDEAATIGSYSDTNVNQVNFAKVYVGAPVGPDALDYANNINVVPAPPANDQFTKKVDQGSVATKKVGSQQQILDYHPYLQTADDPVQPAYLKPGQVRIGKADPNGYGIYYSVDLGETSVDGVKRPLLHVVMVDTPRLMTDAGYYDFNFDSTGRNSGDPTRKNFNFDPTVPNPSPGALFQPPQAQPGDPSLSYQMFSWVRDDLQNSNAVWKVVTGHHTAYHVGNGSDGANDGYYNSPVMVRFLAGLKDANGQPLFNAYFNGHSHAYGRVLEMARNAAGVGVGIPFITTGNGGKVLDDLNQAPYGTSVLSPENWANNFTDASGKTLSNAQNNGLTQAYLDALPVASQPTSVGLSGYYRYSGNNYPQGWNVNKDGKKPGTRQIQAVEPNDKAKTKTFELADSVYNTLLQGDPVALKDVSGLYGYGSGAAYVEADSGYLFTNYRTAHPLDPAITLIGRQQGLSDADMQRGSLFYEQWSPQTAALDDLALFSFDVVIDAASPDGRLDALQLVQKGNGYLETAIGANSYRQGTYRFEILGNNPSNPLGFDRSDPTRAVVDLTFDQGHLKAIAFAKDASGKPLQGSGYKELANALNVNNLNQSSTASALVAININLEANYTFADQAPGKDLYQDWYLIADTALKASPASQGSFGSLAVQLQPSSPRARQILATQPLTTGYSGTGAQAAYPTPQRGSVDLRDALGATVAAVPDQAISNGLVSLRLDRRPAPGPLKLSFGGDPLSSYQVNYRPAESTLAISYGSWSSGLQAGPGNSLVLAADLPFSVTRSDALPGSVSFGLRPTGRRGLGQPHAAVAAFQTLLPNAQPASAAALSTDRIFTPSGAGSWTASQGQAQGSSIAAPNAVAGGAWLPVATDTQGRQLNPTAVTVSGNTAAVSFEGGFAARYSFGGSGLATQLPGAGKQALTVQRGSSQSNGLALYEADPITGAITSRDGRRLVPGDGGYLPAALDNARAAGLLLGADQLPAVNNERTIADLPLLAGRNYGLLLLRRNDPADLVSSFARANPGNQVAAQSFAAPGRGVIFGFEDQPLGSAAAADFSDLIVSLSAAEFSLG